MQLGLITDSVGNLPLSEALGLAVKLGLDTVEIATGNRSEAPHADLAELVASGSARKGLLQAVTSRGLTLSALNANGNQLHPATGRAHDRVIRAAFELRRTSECRRSSSCRACRRQGESLRRTGSRRPGRLRP